MKKTVFALALFVLVCPMAWPGVVIEMETKDPGSTDEAPVDTIYAQGEMLRMDPHADRDGSMSVIFRDETLWVVSHDEKTCQTIDKQGMEELSQQIGGMMKQMEAELAKLPPEQRAMVEEMMKDQMPGGMPGKGAEAPPRRIDVGAVEQVGDYSCTLRTLYSGDEKIWEVCAAEEGLPAAASEALEAFGAMARFAEQLRESMQQGPFTEMVDTPFYDMDEIGGFPVRTRMFANGRVTDESILKSMVGKNLDESVFAIPKGYKVKNLADEMK
jgi:hypothetical protein